MASRDVFSKALPNVKLATRFDAEGKEIQVSLVMISLSKELSINQSNRVGRKARGWGAEPEAAGDFRHSSGGRILQSSHQGPLGVRQNCGRNDLVHRRLRLRRRCRFALPRESHHWPEDVRVLISKRVDLADFWLLAALWPRKSLPFCREWSARSWSSRTRFRGSTLSVFFQSFSG